MSTVPASSSTRAGASGAVMSTPVDREASTTVAPSARRRSATAAPMPLPPPVTTAVRPAIPRSIARQHFRGSPDARRPLTADHRHVGGSAPDGYVSATHARWLTSAPDQRWREEEATLVFADVSGFTA